LLPGAEDAGKDDQQDQGETDDDFRLEGKGAGGDGVEDVGGVGGGVVGGGVEHVLVDGLDGLCHRPTLG